MKHKNPLILITGATGAIGPRIVAALCSENYRVRTLSLDNPRAETCFDDIEICIGDVTDASAVHSAMEGVESVVHLAALLHQAKPLNALRKAYEHVNVFGTSTLVEAAIHASVKRIVFFSTIAVYGPSQGLILTEDTPPKPDTFYAQTKLAAEKFVLDAKSADGRNIGVVLRLGAVYGSRIKGNYQRLVQSLARGHFIPLGNGSNRRTLVYDKDVASAAALALRHPKAAGKIFNVSDGEFHTLRDIISTVCQSLNRKQPCISLPVGPTRFVASIVEHMATLVGLQPPIMPATIDKYTEDVAVSSQRIQRELGFVPKYDLAAGWEDAVQTMKRSGDL